MRRGRRGGLSRTDGGQRRRRGAGLRRHHIQPADRVVRQASRARKAASWSLEPCAWTFRGKTISRRRSASSFRAPMGQGDTTPTMRRTATTIRWAMCALPNSATCSTVLDLIAQRRLDVRSLITHRFPLEEAVEAYRLIEGDKREPYLGIVMSYGAALAGKTGDAQAPRLLQRASRRGSRAHRHIGGGRRQLCDRQPAAGDAQIARCRTARPGHLQRPHRSRGRQAVRLSLLRVGVRGIACGEDTDAVLIATRHDTHAPYVCQALRAGKHVYVEKPLALRMDELADVTLAHEGRPGLAS